MPLFSKKVISFILLVLVVSPLLFGIFFLIQQQVISWQMEERLENEAVITIITPLEKIIWVTEEKEVIINGEIFDVKGYTINNGMVTLTGLYDKAEKEIISKLTNTIGLSSTKNSSAPLSKLALKFLSQSYICQSSTILPETPIKFIKQPFIFYKEKTDNLFISGITHPPQPSLI